MGRLHKKVLVEQSISRPELDKYALFQALSGVQIGTWSDYSADEIDLPDNLIEKFIKELEGQTFKILLCSSPCPG